MFGELKKGSVLRMKKHLTQFVAILWLAVIVMLPTAAWHASAQDATPAASPVVGASDLEAATQWLMSQQLDTGAFAGFSGEADAGTTIDAMLALESADRAGVDTGTSIEDAIAYLASDDVAVAYEQVGVGQAAKLVIGLVAVGEDPHDFAGSNPIVVVEAGQDSESGIYGSGLYDHAYALMALASVESDIPATAYEVLTSTQTENGGWSFDASNDPTMADSNTTAMIIQALVATGNGDHETMDGALEFLNSTITDEGAAYAPSADADANSTGVVLQALIAVGADTTTLEAALPGFMNADGSFFYQAADPTPNLFSSVQAIPALAGEAFPLLPPDEATPVASLWSMTA